MSDKTCTVVGCTHSDEDEVEIVRHIKEEHSVLEAFGHAFMVNAVKTGHRWDPDDVPQMEQIEEEYEEEIDFMDTILN